MKFLSLISLLLCLLLTLSSCGTKVDKRNTVDLMKTVIDASDYRGDFENFPSTIYGTNAFSDYTFLHSNPLQIADYIVTATSAAKSNSIKDFGAKIIKAQAHNLECDFSFDAENNLKSALQNLFTAVGDDKGLNKAYKSISKINPSLKKPLARFISAVSYAYSLTESSINSFSEFNYYLMNEYTYCTPAGSCQDLTMLKSSYDLLSEDEFNSILQAGQLMIRETSILADKLSHIKTFTKNDKMLTISTPIGDIILGTSGDDTYDSPNAMLLIDPKGNDTYNGKVAASDYMIPVSVLIDTVGDDVYESDSLDGATQGSGIFGTGLLFDMDGNDTYKAERLAQGCCLIGTGVLYDELGNDKYDCKVTGQASGFYGFALLSDASGNDEYKAYAFSQASAGNLCQAYTVDLEGDDSYYVEPYVVEGYEELDYGQYPGVNGNWSQGCGWGQRVINVSGGVAGMIDLGGNDTYEGGIWVLGTGYWSGVGFVSDIGGDDSYISRYYSQSSVAHYGISGIIDIGGNDKHILTSTVTYSGEAASISFVWDRGASLLINDGGDDVYIGQNTMLGCAYSAYDPKGIENQDMTYSIFIDTEGDDQYVLNNGRECVGYGRGGYFIDAAGEDNYQDKFYISKNNEQTSDGKENGVFLDYEQNDDNKKTPIISFYEKAKKHLK